jgi:hypothetical protein
MRVGQDAESGHVQHGTGDAGADVQVVSPSLEGDGRIVTMTGTPSADTRIMNTLGPGTGANVSRLENHSAYLTNISGEPGADKVNFYRQDADFPPEIRNNVTFEDNEEGGPLLAAFDHAVDLEVPADARTTYVGYSAGGSMLGTHHLCCYCRHRPQRRWARRHGQPGREPVLDTDQG